MRLVVGKAGTRKSAVQNPLVSQRPNNQLLIPPEFVVTRDWLLLLPEPGARACGPAALLKLRARDLNPVQGPLRSYLRSAAQAHAKGV